MFGLINKVTGCKGLLLVFQNIFQVQLPVTYNMQVCIYQPPYIIIARNNLLQRGIMRCSNTVPM